MEPLKASAATQVAGSEGLRRLCVGATMVMPCPLDLLALLHDNGHWWLSLGKSGRNNWMRVGPLRAVEW